jgi:hypothetical protein
MLAGAALIAWSSLSGCAGDESVDPPTPNPRPTQRVKLYVTAPPGLNVRVGVNYRIGYWLGLFGGGGEYCGPNVHTPPDGMTHPVPGAIVPIDLKWNGRTYEGEFLIDRFLPGRCHWTFSSLDTLSPARNFVSLFSEERTNYNFDTSPYGNTYDQSPVQDADLWCGPDPSPREGERGKMLCTSLDYFVLYPGTVASELVASIPVSQYDRSRINLFPFTTSVTLRYHDLVAENHAAIAAASAQSKRRLPCPTDAVRIYLDDEGQTIVNGTNVASGELLSYLSALTPRPKRACYALAVTQTGPSGSGTGVLVDIGILKLPLALYGDNSFTTPVQVK